MEIGNITRPHSAQVRSGRPSKTPLSPERTFATIPALNSPRLRSAQPPLLSASIVSLLFSSNATKSTPCRPLRTHPCPPPWGTRVGTSLRSCRSLRSRCFVRSGGGSRPSPKSERCSIYYRLWTAINFRGFSK